MGRSRSPRRGSPRRRSPSRRGRSRSNRRRSPPRGGRSPPRGGRSPPRGGRSPPRGGRSPPRGGRSPRRRSPSRRRNRSRSRRRTPPRRSRSALRIPTPGFVPPPGGFNFAGGFPGPRPRRPRPKVVPPPIRTPDPDAPALGLTVGLQPGQQGSENPEDAQPTGGIVLPQQPVYEEGVFNAGDRVMLKGLLQHRHLNGTLATIQPNGDREVVAGAFIVKLDHLGVDISLKPANFDHAPFVDAPPPVETQEEAGEAPSQPPTIVMPAMTMPTKSTPITANPCDQDDDPWATTSQRLVKAAIRGGRLAAGSRVPVLPRTPASGAYH
eukprot:TRINITY_DN14053_c0_g1_i1.p1 TRINITY_DN14053_c0_g1~~TRINITY_DN14053_c0_g1_i1.p1  ORF type:complete len:324 (-),score=14.85 TRINITY_DN14053_c0_g1_i1:129-1100(-)